MAVKILKDRNDKSYESEILSLKELENLHVAKLLGWGSGSIQTKGKDDRDARYIITEYGVNGEFFDYVNCGQPLTEQFARYFFGQLL